MQHANLSNVDNRAVLRFSSHPIWIQYGISQNVNLDGMESEGHRALWSDSSGAKSPHEFPGFRSASPRLQGQHPVATLLAAKPEEGCSIQCIATINCYGYNMYIMEWEWDEEKNFRNRAKHGVAFEEALQAFSDPNGIEKEDVAHSSTTEQRRWRTGKLASGRIITVVYMRKGQILRLITAQERRRERKEYEETNEEKEH